MGEIIIYCSYSVDNKFISGEGYILPALRNIVRGRCNNFRRICYKRHASFAMMEYQTSPLHRLTCDLIHRTWPTVHGTWAMVDHMRRKRPCAHKTWFRKCIISTSVHGYPTITERVPCCGTYFMDHATHSTEPLGTKYNPLMSLASKFHTECAS